MPAGQYERRAMRVLDAASRLIMSARGAFVGLPDYEKWAAGFLMGIEDAVDPRKLAKQVRRTALASAEDDHIGQAELMVQHSILVAVMAALAGYDRHDTTDLRNAEDMIKIARLNLREQKRLVREDRAIQRELGRK